MRAIYDVGIRKTLRLVGLAVAVICFLPACHPAPPVTPDYQPPQMELEEMVSYYPLEAYLNGIEGRVVVLVRIEGSGEVSDVRVTVSSKESILDSAAREIARVIRFTPAQLSGQPQATWLRLPISFTLEQLDGASINIPAWQRTARELQFAATAGEAEEKRVAERELLDHYVRLAYDMIDAREMTANRTVLEIVLEPVRDQWAEYQKVWPLPFVLFQDFLVRCPRSTYAGLAGQYFQDYLQYEIALLTETPMIGPAAREERQKLLNAMTSRLEGE